MEPGYEGYTSLFIKLLLKAYNKEYCKEEKKIQLE